MKLELLLGAMKNIETSKYGSPYEVIDNIRYANEKGINVLIGPEWSLTCSPGIFTNSMLRREDAKRIVNTMFNAPDYIEYAPRDARDILAEARNSGVEKFDDTIYVPHSKREYDKIIKSLLRESRDSDMVIYPGTGMFYDSNKILYNHMPVIKAGRVIKNIYKFNDGLGSRFNLDNMLKLYPSQTSSSEDYSRSFGDSPIIEVYGLKTAVEICADAGILKKIGIRDIDLQILSSCGNSTSQQVTNKEGYLAIVDGDIEPRAKVVKKYIPKLKPVEKNERMDIFSLDFEL